MPLVATPGAPDANSYVSLADALAFCEGELGVGAFTGAAASQQEAALRTATTWLDRLSFIGSKTSEGQALKWPRAVGVEIDERTVGLNEIPPRLVRCTVRLAVRLLQSPDVLDALPAQVAVREKVGPIETEFGSGSIAPRTRVGLYRFPDVLSELAPLLVGGGAMTVARA